MEAPNLCQELQEEGETEVQLSRQMATLALLARGGHGSPEGSKPDQALIFHSPVMFFRILMKNLRPKPGSAHDCPTGSFQRWAHMDVDAHFVEANLTIDINDDQLFSHRRLVVSPYLSPISSMFMLVSHLPRFITHSNKYILGIGMISPVTWIPTQIRLLAGIFHFLYVFSMFVAHRSWFFHVIVNARDSNPLYPIVRSHI